MSNYICCLCAGLESLRITELIVPRHANHGTSVSMVCKFDLGRGRLYSVKWYKDELEFYRFMPEYHPQSQVFPQAGIQLDVSIACMFVIPLKEHNMKFKYLVFYTYPLVEFALGLLRVLFLNTV